MTTPPLCDHCLALAEDLRAVGKVMGAGSIHYAMAAVIEAQREGHSADELAAVVSLMGEHRELQPARPKCDDVAPLRVVSSVPRAAVVAQVIEMGRGERNV